MDKIEWFYYDAETAHALAEERILIMEDKAETDFPQGGQYPVMGKYNDEGHCQ